MFMPILIRAQTIEDLNHTIGPRVLITASLIHEGFEVFTVK